MSLEEKSIYRLVIIFPHLFENEGYPSAHYFKEVSFA